MNNKIKKKDIKKFERIANELADLMREIQTYCPHGHVYCNMDIMELRASYDDVEDKDAFVTNVHIPKMDCGEL